MRRVLKKISFGLVVFFAIFGLISINSIKYSDSEVLAKVSDTYLDFTNVQKYKDNDIVETIVVLEKDSLLSTYDVNEYDEISDYITSKEGKKLANELTKDQEQLLELIKDNNISIDLSNSYNYTVVMNAISFKTKVENLDKIAKLDGVKDVMLSNKYEAFESDGEISELEDVTYTDLFMDTKKAWDEGYTGEGMAVAIIDTGADVNHEAFRGDIENPRYTKENLTEIIKDANLSAKGVINADVVYHSEKIPYAFDYANNDTHAYAAGQDHGTHVAGIVGGNSGKIRGAAIDAQLVIMKVFDDQGSAFETYILAGVEDSLKLGVDVANMSLGTPCGNSYSTEKAAEVYSQVKEKGVNLICAAGNDSYVGISNIAGNNLPFASAPDYGVVASPSTYEYALSVASMDNKTYTSYCLNFENKVFVEYAQTSNSFPIGHILNGQTLDIVEIPNVGNPEDYEGIDAEGKVVLVPRGTISFSDKHDAATEAGAVAMIVFDPAENTLIGMQIEEQKIPCVFITNKSYNKIKDAGVKTITITNNDIYVIENPDAGQISPFSSRGTTLSLQIKPEISGPGGYIYSSIGDNQYAEFSGTSMASPNVAGAAALVRQYVKEKYPEMSNQEVVDLVNQLLMSTANPIIGKNGTYSSVRGQGSGIANAYDAVKTNALLSVKDQARPKAELGSSEQGVYTYTMYVENIGTESITYKLNTVTITDEYIEVDGLNYASLTSRALSDEEVNVTYSENVVNGEITVKANEKVEITVTIKVTNEFKTKQDEIFTNGSYVEGYTFLETTTDQQLVVPFLGFYGDFDNLPLLEGIVYDEDAKINLVGSMAAIFNASNTGYELGYNVATDEFFGEYIYYSCSNMQKNVLTSYNALNRNVDFAKYVITDKEGNVVYESSDVDYKKAAYFSNGGYVLTAYDYEGWDGTKKDGTKAVNGEEFKYTTTIGYYEEDGETVKYEETWSFDFKIDSTAPDIVDSKIVVEDGVTYLDIYTKDNVSASYAVLYSFDLNYQLAEPVGNTEGKQDSKFRFNLDEIVKYMQENKINPSQIKVEVNDWAYNFTYQSVTLGPSVIKLDETYKVAINGTKDLSPVVIPANVDKSLIKYESADERIATVDENGVITGVSDGTTTITVSALNGVSVTTEVIVGGAIDTSIEITNGNVEIDIDSSLQLYTEILPLNVVDKNVVWTSSDESVVKVSSYGKITGVGVGEATITATSASGNTASIKVVVKHPAVSSIFLYSSFSTMYVGEEKKIEMITVNPYVEGYTNLKFTTSDEEIMTISPLGVMTAHKEGFVTVIVSSLDGKVSSSLEFVVSNVNATSIKTTRQIEMKMSETHQIEATVYPHNTTVKTMSYKSNNLDIATIDENGVITPKNIGTAEIEITCGNATTTCYVTVLPQDIENITSSNQFIVLNVGEEKTLEINIQPSNATFKKLFYSTSDSNIVTVNNGSIKAISSGIAIITVKTINDVYYNFYIVVKDVLESEEIRSDFDNVSVDITENYFDLKLSKDELKFKFVSEKDDVAIVSNGYIYCLNSGITTIYVYNNAELFDTFIVNVKQEIKNIRNKFDNVSMNSDENLKNLELSNNEQKLTFISDNTDVAIVSNGIVYNQGIGKSTIYVYDQTELVDTFIVEVNEVAKKKGCSNTVVVDVLLLTSALSIAFILLKKKH